MSFNRYYLKSLPYSLTLNHCMHTFESIQFITNEMDKKSRKNNQTIENRLLCSQSIGYSFFSRRVFLWVLCVYDLISTRQIKSLVTSVSVLCPCCMLLFLCTSIILSLRLLFETDSDKEVEDEMIKVQFQTAGELSTGPNTLRTLPVFHFFNFINVCGLRLISD